ncbi:MAG: 2TM domain-containing protein [Xenococcaceae cyanobacterium]
MPYNSDDVQNILKLAMDRSLEDSFSQQQLEEMAAELGISSDALKNAEQEWIAQNKTSRQRQEILKRRKRGFMAHFIPYLAVNTFLVILNLVTTPKIFWAIYPISGWGLGLFFHGWAVYQMPVKNSDRKSLNC